jgi:CTP:molybdopterin cytidylyltransferase MocA
VDRGVALLRDGGAEPVAVVTGAASVEIPGVVIVHNPAWHTGMASSLTAGLGALAGRCEAVVVALVDQPLIGPAAVQRLISAHHAGAGIAVATYHGKRRNPVLLARPHWEGVLAAAAGDAGARPYLRAHPGLVTEVECADIGSPDDIDTPGDLARVRELLALRRP